MGSLSAKTIGRMTSIFEYLKNMEVRVKNRLMRKGRSNLAYLSVFPQSVFCGNAGIDLIVEILAGLQQLLENLFELFTIPWKTLWVYHITTKVYFIFYKYLNILTSNSIYRTTGKTVYRVSGKCNYRTTGKST
jgi:hypothetical protein